MSAQATPPVPRSAYRLVIFAVDAVCCAGDVVRRAVDEAITMTVARLEAGPGSADHRFAAVVYGAAEVRVIPVGAPRPWDLALPSAGPARVDGAAVAIDDLAGTFLAAAPDGLPAGVEVLGLVSPGDTLTCARDLRVGVATVDSAAELADEWWLLLAALRAARRRTVVLR